MDPMFWMSTKTEILSNFKQTLNGWSKADVERLQKEHGPNEIEEEEGESIFDKIKEQLEDILVRILLGAAVISFILALTSNTHEEGITAYIEPLVILLILIANATIGIWQDISADNAISALKKLQATHTNVRRDNQIQILDAKELVPGDIVLLKEGERVPADVRMLEIDTSNFMINQSNFTGETKHSYKMVDPIDKKKLDLADRLNICFSSTWKTSRNDQRKPRKRGQDTFKTQTRRIWKLFDVYNFCDLSYCLDNEFSQLFR
jgi:magnesium-transporting ATPase (P-type)